MLTTGGGGSFANVGFTTGLILPYLERLLLGLHFLLRVRGIYYACGWFITRAEDLLRVLPPVRSRFLPPTAPLY